MLVLKEREREFHQNLFLKIKKVFTFGVKVSLSSVLPYFSIFLTMGTYQSVGGSSAGGGALGAEESATVDALDGRLVVKFSLAATAGRRRRHSYWQILRLKLLLLKVLLLLLLLLLSSVQLWRLIEAGRQAAPLLRIANGGRQGTTTTTTTTFGSHWTVGDCVLIELEKGVGVGKGEKEERKKRKSRKRRRRRRRKC